MFSAGLSPDIIDTANVMTGAFPAEYGNRFGGVVDVATRSGLRMHERGSATFSTGDQGRRRAAADIGGQRGAFGYFMSASTLASERFLSPPDPERHSRRRQRRARVRPLRLERHAHRRHEPRHHGLTLSMRRSRRHRRTRNCGRPRTRNRTRRQQTLTFGWAHAWSNQRRRRIRLCAQLAAAAVPRCRSAERAHVATPRRLETIGAKADVTRASPAGTSVKVGLDAVRASATRGSRLRLRRLPRPHAPLALPHVHIANQRITFNGRDSGSQLSAFAQDNIQLGGRVTADLGLRVDRYALVIADTM